MEKITTAASVSAAWRGMSDEEQYTALQKMAWTVRRGGSKRGAEWIQTQDDAMNVAAEAWLRMGAALERNERADEPRPLNLILYSACAQAANTIARREKRYFSATASLTMEDGEMTDLFDMKPFMFCPHQTRKKTPCSGIFSPGFCNRMKTAALPDAWPRV